ncbi:MAG TPA: hypothetical protein VGG74_23600 [Kofleriaceae bacterium]
MNGHIAVGQPYTLAGADPTANYESHCPVEIDGLISRAHPIIGGGTLAALLSGIKALGMHLDAFIARGGRVLDPADDSELPLDVMFGSMLRAVELPERAD